MLLFQFVLSIAFLGESRSKKCVSEIGDAVLGWCVIALITAANPDPTIIRSLAHQLAPRLLKVYNFLRQLLSRRVVDFNHIIQYGRYWKQEEEDRSCILWS